MAPREARAVPGFRTFWETKKKKVASQNLTFVQVEIGPTGGAKKKAKNAEVPKAPKVEGDQDINADGSPPQDGGASPPVDRRKQVYQAQKRHRRRKAEYAQSLEDEIAQLKLQHAVASSEGHRLVGENLAISQYLMAEGILSDADGGATGHSSLPLDPNLFNANFGFSNLDLYATSPLPSQISSDYSGSDAGDSQSSIRDKGYLLLDPSDFQDPKFDSSSKLKIRECRDLLLKDVHPFEPGEEEDKKTWETLAELILDDR